MEGADTPIDELPHHRSGLVTLPDFLDALVDAEILPGRTGSQIAVPKQVCDLRLLALEFIGQLISQTSQLRLYHGVRVVCDE